MIRTSMFLNCIMCSLSNHSPAPCLPCCCMSQTSRHHRHSIPCGLFSCSRTLKSSCSIFLTRKYSLNQFAGLHCCFPAAGLHLMNQCLLHGQSMDCLLDHFGCCFRLLNSRFPGSCPLLYMCIYHPVCSIPFPGFEYLLYSSIHLLFQT